MWTAPVAAPPVCVPVHAVCVRAGINPSVCGPECVSLQTSPLWPVLQVELRSLPVTKQHTKYINTV